METQQSVKHRKQVGSSGLEDPHVIKWIIGKYTGRAFEGKTDGVNQQNQS